MCWRVLYYPSILAFKNAYLHNEDNLSLPNFRESPIIIVIRLVFHRSGIL